MGGQTGLNPAVQLERAGVLARYRRQAAGTGTATIERAEDRRMFADLMEANGLPVLQHTAAANLDEPAPSPPSTAIRSSCGRRSPGGVGSATPPMARA